MSLPIEVYVEPVRHFAIDAALERASGIIEAWLANGQYAGDEDKAAQLIVGWTAVDLTERIAEAILEARGYDVEELHALVDIRPSVPWAEIVERWKPRCRCGAAPIGLDFDGAPICDACAQNRADAAWAAGRVRQP